MKNKLMLIGLSVVVVSRAEASAFLAARTAATSRVPASGPIAALEKINNDKEDLARKVVGSTMAQGSYLPTNGGWDQSFHDTSSAGQKDLIDKAICAKAFEKASALKQDGSAYGSAEAQADQSGSSQASASGLVTDSQTNGSGPAVVAQDGSAHGSVKAQADQSGSSQASTSGLVTDSQTNGSGPATVVQDGSAHGSVKAQADQSGSSQASTSGLVTDSQTNGSGPAVVAQDGSAHGSVKAQADQSGSSASYMEVDAIHKPTRTGIEDVGATSVTSIGKGGLGIGALGTVAVLTETAYDYCSVNEKDGSSQASAPDVATVVQDGPMYGPAEAQADQFGSSQAPVLDVATVVQDGSEDCSIKNIEELYRFVENQRVQQDAEIAARERSDLEYSKFSTAKKASLMASSIWMSVKANSLIASTSAQNSILSRYKSTKDSASFYVDKYDKMNFTGSGHDGKIIAGTAAVAVLSGLSYGTYKLYTSGICGKTMKRLFGKKGAASVVAAPADQIAPEITVTSTVLEVPVSKEVVASKATGPTGKIPSIQRRG